MFFSVADFPYGVIIKEFERSSLGETTGIVIDPMGVPRVAIVAPMFFAVGRSVAAIPSLYAIFLGSKVNVEVAGLASQIKLFFVATGRPQHPEVARIAFIGYAAGVVP